MDLQTTEPRPSLSLATEKIKAAFRISYSLFDKVGFFMNAYMELGIPEEQIKFRTLWRAKENKPIRTEFDLTGNWGFCALYWLAKDFFEKANDEVAEPQARGLSDIRNHIEHKYLRVTVAESPAVPPDDLALMVPRQQFEGKAIHLLKLARSALIYLAIGVGLEERRREPGRAGMPLDEIPWRNTLLCPIPRRFSVPRARVSALRWGGDRIANQAMPMAGAAAARCGGDERSVNKVSCAQWHTRRLNMTRPKERVKSLLSEASIRVVELVGVEAGVS